MKTVPNKNHWFVVSARIASVFLCLLLARPTAADNVLAGYDLFVTPPPLQGTSAWNFAVLPLPADFFDPGSDPFSGVIQLQGQPLSSPPGLAPTDTIVRRLNDAVLPGAPSSDVVPIEIVALHLVSCNPITVTYGLGSPELWDVSVTLPSPAPGSMQINHTVSDGGTFTSSLFVQPLFTFTRHGDLAQRTANRNENITQASSVQWSHTAPTGALTTTNTSNFFPGATPGNPSGPVRQFRYLGSQFTWDLQLVIIPEPSTALLFAAGSAALALRRKRNGRRITAA